MSNKFALLFILISSAVFISGCISGKDNTPVNATELVPKANIPSGFTFIGSHETSVEINGTSLNANEEIYRNNNEDIYVQLIKNDKPQELVNQYISMYKVEGNQFEEISFNGHNATKIKYYSINKGQEIPYYTIIWTNGSSMIIVGSLPDAYAVLSLATATGR